MPSSVVHLFVAEKLADFFEIKNTAQFYLGAISPDAVNLEGFADQNTRYSAHIRSRDVSVWLENIRNFISENAGNYCNERDFFKGFVVHLLTDIAWDEEVQPRLFDGLLKSGIGVDDLRDEKWNELYRLNGVLMNEPQWAEIKEKLRSSHGVGISTLSAELIERFGENLLRDDYEKVDLSQPLVLAPDDVEITACKVIELYKEIQ